MDTKDLLLDSLDRRGSAYRRNLKLCRDEFSEETIHDLRTSIRRLLAMLDVVAFLTSGLRAKKLSDRLKDQLDELDDLRDIQVMLEEVSERTSTLPELELLQADLEKREKREQQSVRKIIEQIKPDEVDKRLNKLCKAVGCLSPQDLHGKLPQAVDAAYLAVLQHYAEIDPAQPDSIHQLRVAFKKFRYMVEAIHPSLPNFPQADLERMHDYQTGMGRLHDLQVFLETLAEFAQASDSYDPQSVRHYYERLFADALSVYLNNKQEVLGFWRASPVEAFPWDEERTRKDP